MPEIKLKYLKNGKNKYEWHPISTLFFKCWLSLVLNWLFTLVVNVSKGLCKCTVLFTICILSTQYFLFQKKHADCHSSVSLWHLICRFLLIRWRSQKCQNLSYFHCAFCFFTPNICHVVFCFNSRCHPWLQHGTDFFRHFQAKMKLPLCCATLTQEKKSHTQMCAEIFIVASSTSPRIWRWPHMLSGSIIAEFWRLWTDGEF